jgi:hypothetical protein
MRKVGFLNAKTLGVTGSVVVPPQPADAIVPSAKPAEVRAPN